MTYTLAEAARELGIPVRRVRGWVDKGVIRAIAAPRRGMDRRLTAADIALLRQTVVALQAAHGTMAIRPGPVLRGETWRSQPRT
jgi:excisionase family DNA binding protein